jgi:hypothetical protein
LQISVRDACALLGIPWFVAHPASAKARTRTLIIFMEELLSSGAGGK